MDSLWRKYKLDVELVEPLLGTVPMDREVLASHVRDLERAQDDEKPPRRAPEEADERGWTSFYTDDQGRPVLFDYQVKGFLKEAANVLKEDIGIKNLRSHVEQDVFVKPRRTVLADKVQPEPLERPLRAMTMQGPRVTVVRSDTIAAGSSYSFELWVRTKSKLDTAALEAIISYGEFKGLGQWRNGGYGRFTATLTALEG